MLPRTMAKEWHHSQYFLSCQSTRKRHTDMPIFQISSSPVTHLCVRLRKTNHHKNLEGKQKLDGHGQDWMVRRLLGSACPALQHCKPLQSYPTFHMIARDLNSGTYSYISCTHIHWAMSSAPRHNLLRWWWFSLRYY